jgi:hypothetical protein
MPYHPLNWTAGWSLILAGFVVGAGLGLASTGRTLGRLIRSAAVWSPGHIALKPSAR